MIFAAPYLDGLPDTALAWALAYAAVGFRVFPVDAERKPLIKDGFKAATNDLAQIETWWAKWSHADVAAAVPNGVAVIDLDCKKGKDGRAAYHRLEGVDPEAVEAPMATSPTGGLHIWTDASGRKLKQVSGYEAEGIDLRLGGRGYVVLPGAGNGRHWRKPLSTSLPPTPAWVKEEAEPHPSQAAAATPGATTPYGRKALDNACAKIRAAGPGERDAAIGKVALKIGSLIGGGEIDEAEALSQLLAAAVLNGGDFAEQKAKIGRAVEIGKQQPKSAPQKATDGLDASEDALAQRFAEVHAADMRYVALWGQWLIFDGKVWRRDDTLHAFTRARRICRDAAAQDLTRAKTLLSAATVAAVERLARSDPRLAASADQWDRDIWLLNTPGGVVDLRTGAIREAASGDYMTKLAGVSPALDAHGQPADACPTFYDFLEEVFPRDDDLHRFLQRLAGYALTGSVREHVLAFGHGVGRNGKGTFVAALAHVFGDYHRAAEVETFLVTRSERHSQDLARLAGARLVTASEPEDRQRWATARVKKLTGGDRITARYMRENDFEYDPQFLLFIIGNHKPAFGAVDPALRDRLLLLPFNVYFPPDKRDHELIDKLKAEAGGILSWAIKGVSLWLKQGLAPPPSVVAATEAYLASEDLLTQWVDDCCVTAQNAEGQSSALFSSWRFFADAQGERAGTSTWFRNTLEGRGYVWRKTKKKNVFMSLDLSPEEAERMAARAEAAKKS